MTREEYRENLFKAWTEGRITDEAFDAGMMNIDDFCQEEEEY